MKLLHKNIAVNTLASILIIVSSGFITYSFVKNHFEKEAKEHLLNEKESIEFALDDGVSPKLLENNIGDKIWIEEIPRLSGKKPYFKIIAQSENEEEEEEQEEEGTMNAPAIVFEYRLADKFYKITLIKLFDEDEKLVKDIVYAISISSLLMVLILVVVNIFIYKKLWGPFYKALQALKEFNVSKQHPIHLPAIDTKEFDDLNRSLTTMTEKSVHDYIALKEFTENASHEIQTPLAIISSKIEMCLQDKGLNAEQAKLLMEANHAVNTLFTLNKALVLLTKLENNQFEQSSQVNVADKIISRINLFEDFIQGKEIDVNYKIDESVHLSMDPNIAKVLFDNLIKNAVKHNVQNGKINIEVTKERIKIANTGKPPKDNSDKRFERFYKAGSEDSLGLGLAIVKKICEINRLKIDYNYNEGWHSFTIVFSSQ